MKRTEKRQHPVLKTFSDTNMTMDPKFKAKLNKQVIKYDKQLDSGKRGFAWPKFVLAPVLLFALVVVGGLALLNGGDLKKPLSSQPVSAAEVIERSQDYYKTLDLSKYTFQISKNKTILGPKNNCSASGASEFRGMGNNNSYFISYTYMSKNDTTEASYTRIETEEDNLREESFYSNNSTALRKNLATERQNALPPIAEGSTVAGKSVYKFVDKNGKKLLSGDLVRVQRDGREVYVFYMIYNTDVVQPHCENEIIEAIFDANTYANMAFNTYQGYISPEQLIVGLASSETYQDISEAEALRIMAEAGFDKEKAASKPLFVPVR